MNVVDLVEKEGSGSGKYRPQWVLMILIPDIPSSLSSLRTKRPVVIENCGEIGQWLRSYFARIDGTVNISNDLETSETVQLCRIRH